ncbi:hypothetical protein NDU88_006578 [Pleurodeles waltl]|uniref:Uncharacterized protein n=1 Tax=Pleurodeles waltl TaxID=8319 RepID=A0AAV7L460_PLEWA|nr:hypothetical protein NDU88_006578 [Pleurodeles waltl]
MHHLETLEKADRMKRYKVASSRLATLLQFCRRPEQSAVDPLAEGYLWNKGTKSKSHKQVGDGQMPRKCQLRVQRSFYWTEEAEVSAGTKRARDFPFGGRIPLAVESRAEVFSRRKNANKPC